MIETILNYNYGYKWYSQDGISVKGYLYDENNKLFNDEKLINYFQDIKTKDEFELKVIKANGIFSVIIKQNDLLLCAVDKTRTFPLFYTFIKDELYISDDTYTLQEKSSTTLEPLNADEFLTTGYVTSKDTLLKDVFQLQSGEYLSYENNQLNTKFYFDYLTTKVSNKSFEVFKDEFLTILDNTIQRLIKFADGKQIVLPLSGGYDSRLIASLLKKHNYQNVFCFTYGSKDSFEVNISQKVAKELGYEWYFIEYNEETVSQNFPQSKEFQEYYKFASNHVSIYLTQDYFAVKFLADNNIVNSDVIIVPGHTGDFICGGHINNTQEKSPTKVIINDILNKHYSLNVKQQNKIFKNKILNNIKLENSFSYSTYEDWELRERQSKFIVNANRVYEYFGYKHSIPLWDSELIEFFRVLPLKHKLHSYFFEKVIIEDIFEPLNIGYKKEIKKKTKLNSKVKNMIKKFVPQMIKNKISKNRFQDINRTSLRATPLVNELNENIHFSKGNLIIAKWYLQKIGELK